MLRKLTHTFRHKDGKTKTDPVQAAIAAAEAPAGDSQNASGSAIPFTPLSAVQASVAEAKKEVFDKEVKTLSAALTSDSPGEALTSTLVHQAEAKAKEASKKEVERVFGGLVGEFDQVDKLVKGIGLEGGEVGKRMESVKSSIMGLQHFVEKMIDEQAATTA